jgi:hypothetical protein
MARSGALFKLIERQFSSGAVARLPEEILTDNFRNSSVESSAVGP